MDKQVKVKLSADFNQYKAGEEISVDPTVATWLQENGLVEPFDQEKQIEVAVAAELEKQLDPLRKLLESKLKEIANKEEDAQGEEGDAPAFRTPGEFLLAVYNAEKGKRDPRLVRALSSGHAGESEDAAGGYLVYPEFRAELMKLALPQTVVRQRATVIPAGRSGKVIFPKLVSEDISGGAYFGGVQCYWLGETEQITPTRMSFGRIELSLKDLCGLTFASDDLLQDSAVGLEALIRQAFPQAIAYMEDISFFSGDGVNQPLGFLNSNAVYTVSRANANEISWADIANMFARIYPPSQSRCVWLAHPSCFPQFAQMAENSGTDASLIWIASGEQNAPGTLLGRPIIWTPHCATLGNQGDLCLVDLSYYLVLDGGSLSIDASTHVAFETRETAWRFVHRVDGQPWLNSTIKDDQGYETAAFVVLQ